MNDGYSFLERRYERVGAKIEVPERPLCLSSLKLSPNRRRHTALATGPSGLATERGALATHVGALARKLIGQGRSVQCV